MPIIIRYYNEDNRLFWEVYAGPGEQPAVFVKECNGQPIPASVVNNAREFREAVSNVCVFSVPVVDALGWVLADETLEAHIIYLGRCHAREMGVYQDVYEDIASFWVVPVDGHFNCYLRYME